MLFLTYSGSTLTSPQTGIHNLSHPSILGILGPGVVLETSSRSSKNKIEERLRFVPKQPHRNVSHVAQGAPAASEYPHGCIRLPRRHRRGCGGRIRRRRLRKERGPQAVLLAPHLPQSKPEGNGRPRRKLVETLGTSRKRMESRRARGSPSRPGAGLMNECNAAC